MDEQTGGEREVRGRCARRIDQARGGKVFDGKGGDGRAREGEEKGRAKRRSTSSLSGLVGAEARR